MDHRGRAFLGIALGRRGRQTHLAVAIGRQAILAGYTVLFVPALILVAQLAEGA